MPLLALIFITYKLNNKFTQLIPTQIGFSLLGIVSIEIPNFTLPLKLAKEPCTYCSVVSLAKVVADDFMHLLITTVTLT